MAVQKATKSSILDFVKYRSMLAENQPFLPDFSVQYIVIAGGGGGGSSGDGGGGGGGAGGYISNVSGELSGQNSSPLASMTLSPFESYNVTIGAGGSPNANGSNSVFTTITALGGGRGGVRFNGGAAVGGSGGGNGGQSPAGAAGTANQGFGGGRDTNSSGAGGGGGGAGSAGANNSGSTGGSGGSGIASNITGASVVRAGGGKASNGSTNSGGATGASPGGGGGGALSGGNGAVILRYPNIYTLNFGAGVTGTTTTVGSDKVTQITAGTGNISWS